MSRVETSRQTMIHDAIDRLLFSKHKHAVPEIYHRFTSDKSCRPSIGDNAHAYGNGEWGQVG